MKKLTLIIFFSIILFGCAEDCSSIKNTVPVKVEITSSFTENNVSNWKFEDNSSIAHCKSSWGVTDSYNNAMTLYANGLLNNGINNNESPVDGFVAICDGRVNNSSSFYNFLKIYIKDAAEKQAFFVKFGEESSYEYIVGYEDQLINQAIARFKNNPTASYVGNFYVEIR